MAPFSSLHERSTALHLRPFVRLVLWRRTAGLGGGQGRRACATHARRRVVAAADAVARAHAQLHQASRRARGADERPAVRRAVLERPPVRSRARARIAARRRRRAGRASARRDESAADVARHPARALRARPARRAPGDLARGGRGDRARRRRVRAGIADGARRRAHGGFARAHEQRRRTGLPDVRAADRRRLVRGAAQPLRFDAARYLPSGSTRSCAHTRARTDAGAPPPSRCRSSISRSFPKARRLPRP